MPASGPSVDLRLDRVEARALWHAVCATVDLIDQVGEIPVDAPLGGDRSGAYIPGMPKRILKGIWKAAHDPAWWGVFFGLVALLTQAIPWAWNLATDPADLQLDNASASVVSDYAVFSVRVENHTSRRIYIDTVTARPLRGPHQISSTLCPDANHRDGGIPPQDAALYSLNRNVGRGILAPYRRPTEVEFTVTPKVGDPVDTRATSRYQPGYEETTFTLEQQEC